MTTFFVYKTCTMTPFLSLCLQKINFSVLFVTFSLVFVYMWYIKLLIPQVQETGNPFLNLLIFKSPSDSNSYFLFRLSLVQSCIRNFDRSLILRQDPTFNFIVPNTLVFSLYLILSHSTRGQQVCIWCM